MTNPIKVEFQRFGGRFLTYGRTILIAVCLTAIFLSLYAGLRANYFSIQIITVVISTLSLAMAGVLSYFALRIQRKSSRTKFLAKTTLKSHQVNPMLNEELIRQLILDVQELTPHQLKAISNKGQRHAVEGGLFRLTFLLTYRVAYAFYSTLQLLRLDFPGIKPEKKI